MAEETINPRDRVLMRGPAGGCYIMKALVGFYLKRGYKLVQGADELPEGCKPKGPQLTDREMLFHPTTGRPVPIPKAKAPIFKKRGYLTADEQKAKEEKAADPDEPVLPFAKEIPGDDGGAAGGSGDASE